MKALRGWRGIRNLGLALTACGAPMFYNSMQAEFAGQVPTWSVILAIFGCGALGVPFVISLQYVNPLSPEKWIRPSWDCSLADPRQFLPTFDYGGWTLLALGIFVATHTLWIGSHNLLFLLPLLFGAGTLVGVRLAMLAFKSKLLPPEESDAA